MDADGSLNSTFVAGVQPMRFEDGWGICTPTSDADFQGMCKALDVEGWDDPRVATMTQRRENRDVMEPIMDMVYANAANLTQAQATKRFEAQRVPFAMILSPEQLTRDEHAVAIGLFVEDDHHIVGRTRMPRHPTRFGATPAELTNHSPGLGEHTDEILAELGRADDIPRLRESGVVA
jgi:crotonobetainyl-CoA:carnitine CoA-transferase CaiB-like acyl-CoA transferase